MKNVSKRGTDFQRRTNERRKEGIAEEEKYDKEVGEKSRGERRKKRQRRRTRRKKSIEYLGRKKTELKKEALFLFIQLSNIFFEFSMKRNEKNSIGNSYIPQGAF